MKILLQYQSSSKVVEFEDVNEIYCLVEKTFDIAHQSYILKKYDADFEEYVDLVDVSTISNKDKFKIENKLVTTAIPSTSRSSVTDISSTSEFSVFLSECTKGEDSVNYEVVLNLKSKHWPLKVLLPVNDFSKSLINSLTDKVDLSWELSKELIGHLANYCYQFSKYPSKMQRQETCLALVEMYPHLKSNFGLGVGALEIKLMNKLKRLRQADNSLEVNTIKRASQGKKMPKKIKRQDQNGALNWSPDHFPGENDNTQALHIEILKQECLKNEENQDKNKIKNLMALTYSFRRVDINNKVPVADIEKKYPIFFQVDQQFYEFERLTCIDLKQVFTNNVVSKGPTLFHLFKRKKLTPEQKTFLDGVNFYLENTDIHDKCEAEASYGVMVLPFLFREKMHSFFQIVLPDDNTPTLGSDFPVINGGLDFSGVFEIIIEGCVVTKVSGFLLAVQLLFSYYYTLNISYNKNAENTLKFIQHILLMINEGNMPPKVISLVKKM